MKLPNCRLSISRSSDDTIRIEVTDRDSGTRFFSCAMSLEDFARSVTGQSELQLTEATVRGLDRLGKAQEVKEVLVPIPPEDKDYYGANFAAKHAEWVRAYEVDGWQADVDQRFNGHRSSRGGSSAPTYRTFFRRWVAKE